MATGAGSEERQDDLSELKRKLIWRIGLALLMVVALLGGLAFFDYLSKQPESDAPLPAFTAPVPVPKKPATQPVAPAEPAKEAAKETAKEEKAVPEGSAAPVDKSAPPLEPPPRPEVSAQPVLPKSSAARPAQPERTVPGLGRPLDAKPAAAPVRETAPAPAKAAPEPARLLSGYAVQAGVFADPRRAEELVSRLALEGIPATVEARVQVGPFRTKAEAEAAREKLKALGIEGILLPPKGGKR